MTGSRKSCSKSGGWTWCHLIRCAILFLVLSPLAVGGLFAQVLRDYEELDAVEYLPVQTTIAISIKPPHLTDVLSAHLGYGKILGALQEVEVRSGNVAKCTLFSARTMNKQLEESPFLGLPFKAQGLLARGDFSDINYSGLISFERYFEHEIYYSSGSDCYFVRLDQDLLALSQAPEIIGDVIDVYHGRIPSFAHGRASIINKLKAKSMPYAPVSVIVVLPEAIKNAEEFFRLVASFFKFSVGFNVTGQLGNISIGGTHSITFDGSQYNHLGYFEGAVLNFQNLGVSMYANLNLLFSDARTARAAVGAINIPLAIGKLLAAFVFYDSDLVEDEPSLTMGSRTEGSCAVVDVAFVLSEENANNALARRDLEDAYAAAQVFIGDHPQAGFVQMADLESSGYHGTPGVVTTILEPQVAALRLTARHENGDQTYFIDADGAISEVGGSGDEGSSW